MSASVQAGVASPAVSSAVVSVTSEQTGASLTGFDGDVDRDGVRAAVAVRDLDDEGVAAVVVGVGRVADGLGGTRAARGGGAVRCRRGDAPGQRIARIGIGGMKRQTEGGG